MFFHVSLPKKYVHDNNYVIDWVVIQVEPKVYFQTNPLCILDREVTLIHNQSIRQVKVQWKNFGPSEAMWELENAMKEAYPFLL